MNLTITDDQQIDDLVNMFEEYECNTQNIIKDQTIKIATLSEQVKNLSEDNKTLRIANNFINTKLASESLNKPAYDSLISNKIKSILDNFNKSGFLKTASYNANINEFIYNPNQVLTLLEDISDTFVDLGLIKSNTKFSSITTKQNLEADFIITNNEEDNKNAAVFLTSNNVKNAAASNYEDNLRKQLKSEIQVREEAFLNNLNKSNY